MDLFTGVCCQQIRLRLVKLCWLTSLLFPKRRICWNHHCWMNSSVISLRWLRFITNHLPLSLKDVVWALLVVLCLPARVRRTFSRIQPFAWRSAFYSHSYTGVSDWGPLNNGPWWTPSTIFSSRCAVRLIRAGFVEWRSRWITWRQPCSISATCRPCRICGSTWRYIWSRTFCIHIVCRSKTG